MRQSVIAAGAQNDVLGRFHLGDLPSENIPAFRSVDRAFDHGMVRQQACELTRNVGFPWPDVSGVVDDRITEKEDEVLSLH
jgi:hypothetical protein